MFLGVDFQKSSGVKKVFAIQNTIHDFLSSSISYRFGVIRLQTMQDSTLTFDPSNSFKVKKSLPIQSTYMTSYRTCIDSFSKSRTILYIIYFKLLGFDLDLRPQKSFEVKTMLLFESPYMISYLLSVDTYSLSRTVFELFDFKPFRVWPWLLTFTFSCEKPCLWRIHSIIGHLM